MKSIPKICWNYIFIPGVLTVKARIGLLRRLFSSNTFKPFNYVEQGIILWEVKAFSGHVVTHIGQCMNGQANCQRPRILAHQCNEMLRTTSLSRGKIQPSVPCQSWTTWPVKMKFATRVLSLLQLMLKVWLESYLEGEGVPHIPVHDTDNECLRFFRLPHIRLRRAPSSFKA
jgi:hypothetical protein